MRSCWASSGFSSTLILTRRTLPPAFLDHPLQHRAELLARTAPRRPEIDDHGLVAGRLDDVLHEVLRVAVLDQRAIGLRRAARIPSNPRANPCRPVLHDRKARTWMRVKWRTAPARSRGRGRCRDRRRPALCARYCQVGRLFLCSSSSRLQATACGRSSGVERNLAKVEVEGSNPFARSRSPPGSRPRQRCAVGRLVRCPSRRRRALGFSILRHQFTGAACARRERGRNNNGFQGARTAATPLVRRCPGASSALRREQRKDRALAAGVPAGAGAAARDGCGAR